MFWWFLKWFTTANISPVLLSQYGQFFPFIINTHGCNLAPGDFSCVVFFFRSVRKILKSFILLKQRVSYGNSKSRYIFYVNSQITLFLFCFIKVLFLLTSIFLTQRLGKTDYRKIFTVTMLSLHFNYKKTIFWDLFQTENVSSNLFVFSITVK